MKRLLGTINRRGSQGSNGNGDTPEANVVRGVRLFCESGGPNNSGEEVLHLPNIVEAAESSPAAAREAANRIRKFLVKDNFQRAYVQYNAIMLVRILADNPGKSFTKNLDARFVATVKELLRDGRDMSVQQILRETLESFETQKPGEETLLPIIEMWKKEKQRMEKWGGGVQPIPATMTTPAHHQNQQNYFARNHKPRGLPPPIELAQRVEEARTSSKLLLQVVQSTPPTEIIGNELIKEFVERCQSASRSIQSYIHSDNPPPDEDTLLTLIETNDQISVVLSKHQRALLQARRAASDSSAPLAPPATADGRVFEAPASPPSGPPIPISFHPPPGPPPRRQMQPQDPFDDRHGTDWQHEDITRLPQEQRNYGPSGYPGTSLYHNERASPMSAIEMPGAAPPQSSISPMEARKPVQYRF